MISFSDFRKVRSLSRKFLSCPSSCKFFGIQWNNSTVTIISLPTDGWDIIFSSRCYVIDTHACAYLFIYWPSGYKGSMILTRLESQGWALQASLNTYFSTQSRISMGAEKIIPSRRELRNMRTKIPSSKRWLKLLRF